MNDPRTQDRAANRLGSRELVRLREKLGKLGPIFRDATSPKCSRCDTADLTALDWKNWWQDNGYIHVRKWTWEEGETWHRVYPKRIGGREVRRVAVTDGRPAWLHDLPNIKMSHEPSAKTK